MSKLLFSATSTPAIGAAQPRAGVPSFAGLRALLPQGKKAAEDNKDPSPGQEDDEAKKARRAEEDRTRQEEDARRAEEDQRREDENARRAEEDARRAEEDGPAEPEEDESGKKSGRAKGKGEMDDEECAEEDDPDAKVAAAAGAGRRAERARWVKALNGLDDASHAAAAAVMLATTDMPSAAVLASVKALPATPRSRALDERMSREAPPKLTTGGGDPQGGGFAAQMKAAADKARGA